MTSSVDANDLIIIIILITIQNRMSTKNIIAELERKIDELEEEVIELKSKLSMQQGRKHSKKELRELYEWNEQDVLFSDTVMNFTKEYLFPRFKFLAKGWTTNNKTMKKCFSDMVRRHLKVPRGMTFDSAWDRIITPTIAKKYTDIRCNINNDVRNAFVGELVFRSFDIITWYLT